MSGRSLEMKLLERKLLERKVRKMDKMAFSFIDEKTKDMLAFFGFIIIAIVVLGLLIIFLSWN